MALMFTPLKGMDVIVSLQAGFLVPIQTPSGYRQATLTTVQKYVLGDLAARVATLEQTGSAPVDLTVVNEQLTDHATRIGTLESTGGGGSFSVLEYDPRAEVIDNGQALEVTYNAHSEDLPPPEVDTVANTLTFVASTSGNNEAEYGFAGQKPISGKRWIGFRVNSVNPDMYLGLNFVTPESYYGGVTISGADYQVDGPLGGTGGYVALTDPNPAFIVCIDYDGGTIQILSETYSTTWTFTDPTFIQTLEMFLYVGNYSSTDDYVVSILARDPAASPMAVPEGYIAYSVSQPVLPDVPNGTLLKFIGNGLIGDVAVQVGESAFLNEGVVVRNLDETKVLRSDKRMILTSGPVVNGSVFDAGRYGSIVIGRAAQTLTDRMGDFSSRFITIGSQNLDFSEDSGNVAIGTGLGSKMKAGSSNFFAGNFNADSVERMSESVLIGNSLGRTVGEIYQSILMGRYSGTRLGWEWFRSVVIGDEAASGLTDPLWTGDPATSPTTRLENWVAIGTQALKNASPGFSQIGIGRGAGASPVDVDNYSGNCVFIGTYAGGGMKSTGNSGCIALGQYAMNAASAAADGVAIGTSAMRNAVNPGNSVAIGREAGYNVNGDDGVAVGAYSMRNTTGGQNTAVGYYALGSDVAVSNTHCTAVGYYALEGLADLNNSAALGFQATVTGSNQVQLGNAGTTTYAYGAVQNRSDVRDKGAIRDTVLGLEFIEKLRPRDWRWDMREDYVDHTSRPQEPQLPRELMPAPSLDESDENYRSAWDAYRVDQERFVTEMRAYDEARTTFIIALTQWTERNKIDNLVHDGSKMRGRYHHGLIAQEVHATMEEMGVDFGGYQDHSLSGGQDVRSIGYEELIGPLIRSVQELSAELKSVRSELAALKGAEPSVSE